jgi:hypothetical protein
MRGKDDLADAEGIAVVSLGTYITSFVHNKIIAA